jgi:phosphate starvation-inducible PhoH-like protein
MAQLTDNHRIYASLMHDDAIPAILAIGPAGSLKTFTAVKAFVKMTQDKEKRRLVLMKPNISFFETLGLVPGTLDEKLSPWLRSLTDIFKQLGVKPDRVVEWQTEGMIECIALEHIQGLTFSDAVVVVDEVENMTYDQLLMILKRMGPNSKLVFTGDIKQTSDKVVNGGLGELVQMIRATDHPMRIVEMTDQDSLRSPLVSATLACDENWQEMKRRGDA